MNNKQLIQVIEEKGFEVKGKTKDNWKIVYEIKALKEKYELCVNPVKKKELIKVLLKDIEYWKFVGLEETSSKKAQKEIGQVMNKMKKLIGVINGI